jgi:hypothetical protein
VSFLTQFNREYDRICGIAKLTYQEKTKECSDIFDFFQRFCIISDIATSISQVEKSKIPYYICHLTLRNYLEMQACILEGAYHSAARSLRWLFEINMIGAVAVVKPILLDFNLSATKGLNLSEFEKVLEQCDKEEIKIGKGKRKTIFDQFKLPTEDLMTLYSDLCKYVHLSKISFDKTLDFPNLQFVPEKFDEIFPLAMRTLDFVFWMECKMCLCFKDGTAEALKFFLKDDDGLNHYIPLTLKLISKLT